MAIKHIPDGGSFVFDKSFGFTGSAESRHDARNLPNKAVDNEYGDGSYVNSRPMGGAQDVRALRKARGGSVDDWSTDRAAEARIEPAKPAQRPPVGAASPGKKHGGPIRRAMGGPAIQNLQQYQSQPEIPPQQMPAQNGTQMMPQMARGGRLRRADGGSTSPDDQPDQVPEGTDAVRYAEWNQGYENAKQAYKANQHREDGGAHKRGGRIRRAMGGTVDADYEPKMVSSEVGLNAKPNMGIRGGGNRHAYAQGGSAIPGPAPATTQGDPAAASSPLSQATITMPAPAMAQASAKMLATGAKLGARQAVGQLANAGQRIAAQMHGQRPMPTPGSASPVAAPPQRPAQQGIPAMRRGGGIHIKPSHKGMLHEELGVPKSEKISTAKLEAAKHSRDPAERRRANFALNAKKWD